MFEQVIDIPPDLVFTCDDDNFIPFAHNPPYNPDLSPGDYHSIAN